MFGQGYCAKGVEFQGKCSSRIAISLDGGTFQPNHIIRGYDGELYDGDGNLLAEVNTFQAQINSTNTDYQAAGNKQVWAIPQSYTVTLTFTETVIKDAKILKKCWTV